MTYRLSVVLAVLPLCSGCIQRSLSVESDPPGATVILDHREAGTTPVRLRFTHYGGHSLILVKEGFRPWRGTLDLDEKGWAVFPLDMLSEALLPVRLADRRSVRVRLEKAQGGEPAPDEERPAP